ncbi:MAG TPA: arylsulfatase [Pseudomonadales bacterium]|nr:arylsulfatase [Pseudomonadales bacterium]
MNIAKIGCVAVALVLFTLFGCGKKPLSHASTADGKATVFTGDAEDSIRHSTPDFRIDPQAPANAPNVVIVVADDLGYSDISPYGSEIRTPNIQQLADSGLRYNRFTATAMCSPTRAALLTGLNHHSAGVGWVAEWDFGYPGYRGELAPDAVTLPQILQQHGYATYAAGKWHLTNGEHRSRIGPFDSWPTQKGFDRYWGFLEGETDQFEPAEIISGNEVQEKPKTPGYYFPDDLTHHAIQMIKDLRAVNREKPFFLYYTPGAVHAPHHTKPEDRERYRGKYAEGWDKIREQRLAKQKQLGIAPPNTKLTQHNPQVRDWDALTPDQQKMYARFQENYAGFVDNLDQQVGKLRDYLKKTNQLDNTIFIFMSDNGASPEGDAEGQWNSLAYFHYNKTTTTENLPHFDDIGSSNTHPHYPLGWAQASNTPFKYNKRNVHGGGVNVPFIISWPKGIAAHDEIRPQFHHVDDVAPTILDMLHIQPPTQYRGHDIKAMEGTSFAYTFTQPQEPSHKKEQYYELEANRGYIADGWKIATYREGSQTFDEPKWELFDLNNDFSESKNLATEYPKKVKELEKKWWEAAKRYNALPLVDVGLLERALYSKFILLPQPDHMVFPVGGGTVPHNLAPILPGKSYTITANIHRDNDQQNGVIAAQGDRFSGYSLYLKDNHLVYERNTGIVVIRLVSNDPVPVGNSTIQLRYDKVSTGLAVVKGLFSEGIGFNRLSVLKGTGTLLINGKESGSVVINQPFMIGWEGLDIGRDTGAPVSPQYESPYPFAGQMSDVVYDMW